MLGFSLLEIIPKVIRQKLNRNLAWGVHYGVTYRN